MLKRLELVGFKSFAARTVLEFAPGITAIVGPNGSGKSNIADALRWVLGEQNARQLRARRLEDMIFAGSSQRSSLGMAEVSIVLDNSPRWLPLDFAEVAVARRVYRSDESDYLINGSRVRLKDITDLLEGRVGPGSYAVIGQGMVDAALALRPEDRRVLFDEAAGIRPHRLKLEEARSKLAATQVNLEQVGYILAEIAPRLPRLERQARRAQEHERLVDELAAAHVAWFSHLWRAADTERRQAQGSVAQATEAIAYLERARGETEARLAEVREARQRQREANAAIVSRHQRLIAEHAAVAQAVALLAERLAATRRRSEDVAGEVALWQSQAAGAAEQANAAETTLANATAALELRRREIEGQRATMATIEDETEATRGHWGEKRRELLDAAARMDALQRQLAQLTERVEGVEAEQAEVGRRQNELASAKATLGASLPSPEAELAATVGAIERGERRRIELESARQQAIGRRTATEDAVVVAHRELASLQARLEAASQPIDGSDAAARELLEESLDGVLASLARVLRIPAALRPAIDAALGAELDALVVERWRHAESAIAHLKQAGGRAVFFVLEAMRDARPVQLQPESGVVGVAARLVDCPPRYRPVVDALLGRVIVVSDLEVAHRILRRGLGSVVTVDGELLRPIGAISGGSASPRAKALAREADARDLPAEIERAQEELASAEAAAARLRAEIGGLDESLVEVARELARLGDAQRAQMVALAEAQQRRDAVERELGWLATRRRRLDDEAAALTRQRRDADAEAQRLVTEIAGLEGQVEAAAGELRAKEMALQPLRRGWAEAQQTLARAQADVEVQTALLDSRRQALTLARERMAERSQAAVQAEEAVAGFVAELSSAQNRADDMHAAVMAGEAALTQVSEELAGVEAQEANLATALTALQLQQRDHERALAEARLTEERWHSGRQRVLEEAQREGLLASADEAEAATAFTAATSLADPEAHKRRIDQLRASLRAMGGVGAEAIHEFAETKQRHDFLADQLKDLRDSERSLHDAIAELEQLLQGSFRRTLAEVGAAFRDYFHTFFGGGTARLALTQPDDVMASGVDIIVRMPGRRTQNLALLSGGERALVATALLFALIKARPTPFCLLDEADAALDDANTLRFVEALRELSAHTQFLVITHNRATIEAANTIYGVAVGEDMTSRVVSLRLDGRAVGSSTAP